MVRPTLDFDLETARQLPPFELCDRIWDAVVKACWASNLTKNVGAEMQDRLANGFEEPWRIAYAVHEMEYEVLSGGLKNFFWTHGSVLNDSVLAGLGLIGATEHQALFREAVANPSDEKALSELTRRFYEVCHEVDPRALLAEYIVRNFDEFSARPDGK